jgi:hypothetical protein
MQGRPAEIWITSFACLAIQLLLMGFDVSEAQSYPTHALQLVVGLELVFD